jgi:hypothetical protein
MAGITDTPPAAVQADLASLRSALDQAIPGKTPHDNLLIATWNLKAFASVTKNWTAGSSAVSTTTRGIAALASYRFQCSWAVSRAE